MTRIEWSPDGAALLALRTRSVARVFDLDGRLRHDIPGEMRLLDARWDGERVATFDVGHRIRRYVRGGQLVDEHSLGDAGAFAAWAVMSAGGRRVARDDGGLVVTAIDPPRVVMERRARRDAHVALSDDGTRIAIAQRGQPGGSMTPWSVHEVDTGRELHTDTTASAVDAMAFAFDAAGRHLAFAAPMPMGPIGVVDLDGGYLGTYPEYMAGADAVAIDPHGAIAAFASPGRIRFDDVAAGGTLVLHIPHAPIAIAFSPDSRQLAYLTEHESVGVVPVP